MGPLPRARGGGRGRGGWRSPGPAGPQALPPLSPDGTGTAGLPGLPPATCSPGRGPALFFCRCFIASTGAAGGGFSVIRMNISLPLFFSFYFFFITLVCESLRTD